MNKIILTLLVVTTFCFTAYAQNEKRMQTLNKVLIVYFSATHTTANPTLTLQRKISLFSMFFVSETADNQFCVCR